MPYKLSTSVSYAILFGTCIHGTIYYLKDYGSGPPVAAFCLIGTSALLGAWCWGMKNSGSKEENLNTFMDFIQKITALAIIDIDIGWNYGFSILHTILHGICIAWPLYEYFKNEEVSARTLEIVTTINAASLGILSFLRFNIFGMAAAGVYIFNHFFLDHGQKALEYPKEDVYNYGLAIFVFLIRYAIINETK